MPFGKFGTSTNTFSGSGTITSTSLANVPLGIFNNVNQKDYDFDRKLIELEHAMKYFDNNNDPKSFRVLRNLYLSVQPWRKVYDVRGNNGTHEWQVTYDDQYAFRRKSYLSGVRIGEKISGPRTENKEIAIYPDDKDPKNNTVVISRGTSTGLTRQEWLDEGGAEPGQPWKSEAFDHFDTYTALRIPYGIVGFEGLIDRYTKLYKESASIIQNLQAYQDKVLPALKSRTSDAVVKCRLLRERNARLRKRVLEVSDKVDRFFKEIPESTEERNFRRDLNQLQTEIKSIDIKTKITGMEQQLQLRLDEKDFLTKRQANSMNIAPNNARPLGTVLSDVDQRILYNKLKDIHQGVISLITELKKRKRHVHKAQTVLKDMEETIRITESNTSSSNSRNNLQMMMMEESLD